MSVVVDAVARGNKIECDEFLPFHQGERVRVSIESIDSAEPRRGSAAAILDALQNAPKVSYEDVEELQRLMAESKLPPSRAMFEDGT